MRVQSKSFVSLLATDFVRAEDGVTTTDWTVLASLCVGLALATSGELTDVFNLIAGQVDGEMRDRQMQDDWVEFYASHFQPMLEAGVLDEATASSYHDLAGGMMNHTLMSELEAGIEMLENDVLTQEQLGQLISVASIAHQRNLVDPAVLDYYFGFDGSDPYYMQTASAPPPPSQTS
ncbi:Flp family type IVb pilin [Gymnodinialimonas hymeniacidonis]|uniref:Flp family type IVb pilin n=1 Tax=Gymnodinialimonas hymeniacidonis TaxID=3126508 RepID=UPI0034C68DCF